MSQPLSSKIPALLLHLFPIVPFAMGFYYIGIAAILLVSVAYIKVQKLQALIQDEQARFGKFDPSLSKSLLFWRRLTFLPPEN